MPLLAPNLKEMRFLATSLVSSVIFSMPFRSIACFTTRKKEANITLVLKQVTTKNESSVDGLACMMQFREPEFISSIYLISFRLENILLLLLSCRESPRFLFGAGIVVTKQGLLRSRLWQTQCQRRKVSPQKI